MRFSIFLSEILPGIHSQGKRLSCVDIDAVALEDGTTVLTDGGLWVALPARGGRIASIFEVMPYDAPWPGPRWFTASILYDLHWCGFKVYTIGVTEEGPWLFQVRDVMSGKVILDQAGPEEFAQWRASLAPSPGYRIALYLPDALWRALIDLALQYGTSAPELARALLAEALTRLDCPVLEGCAHIMHE